MGVKKHITKNSTVEGKREGLKRHLRDVWGMTVSGVARRENLNPLMLCVLFNRYWGTDKEPRHGTKAQQYLDALKKYTGHPEDRP